jgi:hypothetical protein
MTIERTFHGYPQPRVGTVLDGAQLIVLARKEIMV